MASSKIKGINIKIGADTTGLDSALKKIEASGKGTKSELSEIERSLKTNKDSVILWSQKQEVLTKAIENSKEKTNLLLQAQKGIEQAFRDGDIDRQEYDKFKEKLQKSTDKLKELKSQQADFEQKFQSGEIDKDAYDRFIKKVERAEHEVQGLENSQRSMEENVRVGTVSAEHYRAFQREIEESKEQTQKFDNQLSEANDELHRLETQSDSTADGVDELGDELQESGQQAENSANGGYTVLGNVFANVITKGIELAWSALKNFTQDVVTTGAEYESAISNVAAISGAMAEEVEMLQAKAEEMGATTKFTAAESAEAMGYMAMAGWKVNDMVSGLDGIMDLSAASGESLASVSDIVTDSLTAFGLTAGDSAHFADVLAAASSNANTNVAMMGETFKYAAPLAGTLKYSIEDMALATGLMANSGIKASQAGTTLNAALSRMAKPTRDMKNYMQQLGLVTMQTFDQSADPKAIEKAMTVVENRTLSAENAQIKLNQAIVKYGENSAQALTATNNLTKAQNSLEEAQEAVADLQAGETASIIDKNLLLTDESGNLKSLRETISTLKEAFSGLSEVQQAEAASALFGKNSMAGMLSIVNAKAEDYNKLAEAIDNADGAAEGMASTMMDNLQGDKTLFESAVDGMKIAVSKELNPALRDLVQYATSQIPKVQAVVEPLFKSAINGVKFLIDGFEKMKPVLSAVKPLIAVVFADKAITLFAKTLMPQAIKLLEKLPTLLIKPIDLLGKLPLMIDSLPSKIAKIPTSLAGVGNSFKALWSVIAANPLAAIGIALTGVAFAAKSYIDNIEIEKTEVEKLIEKHNEELQLLADKRQAIRDLNDAFYENVDGIQYQTDRTKELWAELDRLADKSGNVQQKDKARAEYILSELNSALGTEYTMTGNQIENYKNLSAEIDNVIAKKQAEMMLDSYLANSTEMNKQRVEARTDYEKHDKEYQEKEKALEKAERQFEIYKQEFMNNSKISVEDYIAGNFADNEYSTTDGLRLAKAVTTAHEELQQAENARTQAKITFERTSEYFEKLDDLQEAYSLGQYDRMADIIYREQELTSTTLDESVTDAEQRLQAYSDSCLKTLSDFELAVKDMKQKSVDELEKELSDTFQTGLTAGKAPEEIWANFSKDFKKFQENGLDISPLIAPLVESGASPAEIFGNGWQDVFRTQLKNGGDMTSMLEWMNNSEYYDSIPLIFGNNKNFIKQIREQLGKGLDISTMLELGAKSGLATSEEFVNLFKSGVAENLAKRQNVGNLLEIGNKIGIDLGEEFGESFGTQMGILDEKGIDLTAYIQWAEANGKSVAEVFGENFQTELSAYLEFDKQRKDDKIKNSFYFSFFHNENTLSQKIKNAFSNGEDLNLLAKQAQKFGLKIGDVFGSDFMSVIQEQVNSGFDIQELVKWALESGEEVSEEYSGTYTEIVQKCIDEGYDIEKLLKWGEKSGISTADAYSNKYVPEVQSFIDKGFSIDCLLAWARNAGYTAGQVFGEEFQTIADGYINSNQAKIDRIRQEISDSSYFASFFLGNPKTKFMAGGGFLSHGQAVVAEAGPELLEVMNGGVRVTPLSENSRNHAVSGNIQKNYYSTYTINATISNDYDVSRLAEDLETERRYISQGMGK